MIADFVTGLRHVLLLLMLATVLPIEAACAEVTIGTEKETGLKSWAWKFNGITMQLVQRLPDQTRAFFLGRGFAADTADLIGRGCVFQTIFRNDGKQPVAYDLNDWRVHYQGQRLPLRSREVWDRQWQAQDIDQAARIAFRWSLLPTRQRFEPGDYNWGMTSFGLPPAEQFDLSLVVSINGESVVAKIPALVCAADQGSKDTP
ncbi:MAG: hypothetical protein GY807_07425 [Gammaproteobacteria bacterium]|nr:hypothetical protein [Gammaproteobacteria bacterium]